VQVCFSYVKGLVFVPDITGLMTRVARGVQMEEPQTTPSGNQPLRDVKNTNDSTRRMNAARAGK
jgi:hypothetical protein